MKKHLFIFLLLIGFYNAQAQKTLKISFENRTFVANDSILPFWYRANQNGKVNTVGSVLNLTELNMGQLYNENFSIVNYTWGVNALAGFGETSYYQLNQAFAGILWEGWEIKGGMFHDLTQYGGLSTTNGNLARSQNARPYPKIHVGTFNFQPVPFLENRVSYKVEYSEGLLNDTRYVKNARLHQKSFYLRAHLSPTLDLEAGLEHFVLWGGTSPEETIGELPSGFKDYLRYITGASGDESFPETDQGYVAGNQLGTWQFQLQKRFTEIDITFYLSHLFEELSGLKWRNWPDNLLGLHLNFLNKEQLVTDVVYEYTNTRQQSILNKEDDPDPGNYFRHGIYRSSFTYHQQMLGSPLFYPLILHEGIVRGLSSNRFYAHHLGIKGNFMDHFRWESMITLIHHIGLYTLPYEIAQNQFSGLLEIYYSNPNLAFEFGISAAHDRGNSINQNSGFQLMFLKKINYHEPR
jgi:hypothetical protein